jgi:hypothetical protein
MIKHFRGAEAELDLHPPDEHHVGDMVNRWRHCYENTERLIDVGFSEFEGDMWMPASRGYRGLLVILSGNGELHCDGEVHSFEPGDVIVYEPPVGDQRLASEGCRYVYMTHWDGPEAKAHWGYMAPEA